MSLVVWPPDDLAKCRSCKAPIIWATTANDKKMPLDLLPVEPERDAGGAVAISGLQVIERQGRCRAATIADVPGADLYRSHFATCPNAGEHRRRR